MLEGDDLFYDVVEGFVREYCGVIDQLGFNFLGEYEDFVEGFKKIF